MKLKFFDISEFDSPDQLGSGKFMQSEFLTMLDHARYLARLPFVVTSGYRTEAHHRTIYRKLGRRPPMGSYHLKGRAADIAYKTEAERDAIVKAGAQAGFKGFGIGRTFVHLDNRENFTIWDYGSVPSSVTERYKQQIPRWAEERKERQKFPVFAVVLIVALILTFYYWSDIKAFFKQKSRGLKGSFKAVNQKITFAQWKAIVNRCIRIFSGRTSKKDWVSDSTYMSAYKKGLSPSVYAMRTVKRLGIQKTAK